MSKCLPFINSRFEQEREWPTPAVGPNYTRPVFAENGPGGNMSRNPILVAGGRSFAGLGGLRQGIFGANNVLGASDSGDGGVTDFNFGDALTQALATPASADAAGQACNSPEVIKAVQSMIGTTPDGKWGAASQAKLVEAGTTFKKVAPGCTGDAPGTVATGGGGTVPAKAGTSPFGKGTAAGAAFDNPMTWIVLAAIAAAGIVLFGKKKKAG